MATDIKAKNNGSHELSKLQAARLSDRKWILGRIEVLLGDFYREDLGEVFGVAALMQWADVLEGLPHDAIDKGIIEYQRNGPRSQTTHKLIKPAAGDIYAFAKRFIPKPRIVVTQQPERERHIPSPEEKARVQNMVRKAGYGLRRVDNYHD